MRDGVGLFDSENDLKSKFPDFLDKSEDSNFSKYMKSVNVALKHLRQRVDETRLINKLYRPILIKRVQKEAYKCEHVVIVDIEDVKEVKVYKNDVLIYNEEFDYDKHVDKWEETFEDSSDKVLVEDIYSATVETYNEFFYRASDNEYDEKIDILGKFLNCPRLTFKDKSLLQESDYDKTYPQFNINDKEPDYYYLARMNEYISLMDGMAAPCLYIWKKYLVTTELKPRSRLIATIGEYIAYSERKAPAVFNRFNTVNPLVNSILTVESYFLDENINFVKGNSAIYCKKGEDDFKCIGYNKINLQITDDSVLQICGVYYIDKPPEIGSKIDRENIKTEITTITPRNLDYADYYVSTTGDDDNTGLTPDDAFATLEKALSVVNDDEIIKLAAGKYTLSKTSYITHDCLITGESANNTKIITVAAGATAKSYDLIIPPSVDGLDVSLEKLNIIDNVSLDLRFTDRLHFKNEGQNNMIITRGF